MIDLVDSRAPAGSVSAREHVESLMAQLPAVEAFAVIEHTFGVLPVLETFFELRGAIALGSLGFFTPTPELGWEPAAVEGRPSGQGVVLRGDIRISSPASSGSIVLVRMEGTEHRLAWIDHEATGVEQRGSRTGGAVREGSPCWLTLEGAAVGPDRLSGPVTLAPDGDFHKRLEDYAGVWAFAAATVANDGVRALRRIARTSGHQGTAFNAAQWLAMDITGLEIEAELAATAARRLLEHGGPRGLAAAAAAARILAAVAAKTAELRDTLGLEPEGPLAGGAARVLTAFLGGALMLESEVGRALGIPAGEAAR